MDPEKVSTTFPTLFVQYQTSSSAVAKRPRDASCLSVVSFNIPTVQFFITSYCGYWILELELLQEQSILTIKQ